MTPDQIAVIGLIVVMFALFAWSRWRYDVVAIFGLISPMVLDAVLGGDESDLVVDPGRVLDGFGHPAVVTVAAVLISSRALVIVLLGTPAIPSFCCRAIAGWSCDPS